MEDDTESEPDRGATPPRDDPSDGETDVLGALREGPTRLIPPRTAEARRELIEGDRQLLHCLACGRQVVARHHGDTCLLCGSRAIIVESV